MITITGATGTVGRSLVSQLIAAGHRVRVIVRDARKVAHLAGSVDCVVGDLDDQATLTPALQGSSRLFLLDMTREHVVQAVAAAREAGVSHIVKMSSYEASLGARHLIGGWHADREALIQASGLAWTFLRPGQFMTNAFAWAGMIAAQGAVFSAAADSPVAPIDPRDVAAVAVRALTEPGHEGQAYALTGPSLTTPREQVAILARLIGRDIGLVEISQEDERRQLLAHGVPADIVDGLADLTTLLRSGGGAYRTETVQTITGAPPRDFETWARDHLTVFAPSDHSPERTAS